MSTAPATQSLNVIHWLGLRLAVPGGWELVRHSTSARKGSLVFADRTQQRLQVTWTRCGKRPDVTRLLSDHRARQLEQDAEARFEPCVLPAGWVGHRRMEDDGRVIVRAARFDADTSRLIEAVVRIAHNDTDEPTSLDDLFGGLRVTGDAEAAERLVAFGLDLRIPQGNTDAERWVLAEARVLPADATLTWRLGFDDSPDASVMSVRRRGMAEVWFAGDLEGLLRNESPRTIMMFRDDRFNGASAKRVEWIVPGPRYRKLMNRHRVATAWAWQDPQDNAVFTVRSEGSAKAPPTIAGWSVGPSSGDHDG